MAFSQVAETEDVRNIAQNLVNECRKHIETFNNMLEEGGFSALNLHDNEVTNSTISPFSDKLMMFHISFLESAALAFYGAGLSSSLRSDVIMAYDNIFKDIRTGGMKMYDVLVKHGWLEKQPGAIDRKALYQGKTK